MDFLKQKIRGVRKKISPKILIVALVVIGIGVFVYQRFFVKEEKVVATYEVKRITLQDTLAEAGEILASESATLRFQTGGRMSWVGVSEGDTVKKYDGIASLDTRQLQKTLKKYLNTYSKERRDFEQTQDDNDELAIALSDDIKDRAKRTLENSQYDLENSVLDVELQDIAKEYAFLYSPIDGIITHMSATKAGMNVAVTDTFEVIDPGSLYFSLSVDQTEVVKLTEGMKGTITFDAYPDESITGTIVSIDFVPKSNETGTVYEAEMSMDQGEMGKYRLGMTGDVEFVLKEIQNTVAVPLEYVVEEEDAMYVYKKVGDKKEKIKVAVGEEYGGNIQIVDGIYAGDVIYEINE